MKGLVSAFFENLIKGGSISVAKKFQRTKEDFVCHNCGSSVYGNGYTNHCPRCLWSKHVDVNPGDRQANCQGLMEPIGVELKGGEYSIIHCCLKCGITKKNKVIEADDFNMIIELSTHPVRRH